MSAISKLLALLQIGFDIFGFFMAACMLVVLGIGFYLGLEQPERLAVRKISNIDVLVIHPQPSEVSPAEMNVQIRVPLLTDFLTGATTNAAVWANGKSFKSGGPAAWELVKAAWRLWLLGGGTLFCSWLLMRYRRNPPQQSHVA